jgi:hypothetical protein
MENKMEIILPLEQMSTEEKLRAMETIWDDLCKKADSLNSPTWHGHILHEREGMLKEGDDEFADWEKAKNHIRHSTR